MGLKAKLDALAGIRPVTPENQAKVDAARAALPWHVKAAAPASISNMFLELGQSLLPDEDIRFIGSCRGGAYAVTNRRVLYTSTLGAERRSLPIDETMTVYIDRDLTEVNLRFTLDRGREMKLSGVVLTPARERVLRDALPEGTMF